MDSVKNDWKSCFADGNECNKIARHLLFVIDSITEEDKLKLIARLFCSYVNDAITKDDYFFFMNVVSRAYLPYLMQISGFDEDKNYDGITSEANYRLSFEHLKSEGLFSQDFGLTEFGTPYRLNDKGLRMKKFIEDL